MNRRSTISLGIALMASVLLGPTAAVAQITDNDGDGVLNAPYRGTITSLREACEHLAHGEVRTWIEPQVVPIEITGTIELWIASSADWDRSVLRLYQGLDASGAEVRLDQSSPAQHLSIPPDADGIKRLSLKAIATKTLSPLQFTFNYSYPIVGGTSTGSRTFTVAPMTASFLGSSPGLSEAFQFGTEMLRVSVGAAQLVVPVGRTAEMIGAAYEFRNNEGWNTADTNPPYSRRMSTTDAVLPGAAESVFIQQINQFRLNHSNFTKNDWGTPWPGHLPGFYNSTDTFGPDGTHYDSFNTPSSTVYTVFRRYERVRPFAVPDTHPAAVVYAYDGNNRVVSIRDQATPPNTITLTRNGATGVVERISTSDGRGWDVESTDPNGWVTGIVPDSGRGTRRFEYNSAGRVTRVRDAQNDIIHEFVYINDATGSPTILQAERRLVDGSLQTVVEHEVVSPTLERRREYVGAGQYRQYDFVYDGAQLVSVTSHRDLNGAGPTYTTTYVRDVENLAGTVKLLKVQLPDATSIGFAYDAHEQQGIEPDPVHFGFRTKATHAGPSGSLVTYDTTYEFFYNDGIRDRLFWRPRVVKERDGRGAISEVVFDYENGGQDENADGLDGESSNQLLSRAGPTITLGTSGTRTPQTTYEYYGSAVTEGFRQLRFTRTKYDPVNTRDVEMVYDSLLRVVSETVDPGGLNLTTQYLHCDAATTQDRITVDADGYWTRTRFDLDGRVAATERFLNANAGNVGAPCVDPTGPVYRTVYAYDANGYLTTQTVDNKDQDGTALTPATIVTALTPDDLGRVVLREVDPAGIGQETHFDYNWLGNVEREFDTTGRGAKRAFDGRGLVSSETPLAVGQAEVASLITAYTYDANGRVETATAPTGMVSRKVYDSFGRVLQDIRVPSAGPVTNNATVYEYDAASNITRTTVRDNVTIGTPSSGTVVSDATARFDEGGFNYESRQRTVAGADDPTDPLTQRQFDWAGNVTVETSLGDATVANRIITTQHDTAGRIQSLTDNLGGETLYQSRDGRGNVLELRVRLNAGDYAFTNTLYDALSRPIRITDPEDAGGLRHYRLRFHDSRGNLLRETEYSSNGIAVRTSVHAYDAAGRRTRGAALANAASTISATAADPATDRVMDYQFDADGRLLSWHSYNNGAATPLTTSTTYDALGRIDRVTDPSGSYADDEYDPANGRLIRRDVFDGLGVRGTTFAYDGLDRVVTQTRLGTPDLITSFAFDALDRRVRATDPRGIATRTDHDLLGRVVALVEDEGGALERRTDFGYNRLGQLTRQTAGNTANDGAPREDQVTTFRSDPLGRPTRAVLPDADAAQHLDPGTCTDCIRIEHDAAGRVTTRTEQRGLTTVYAYDQRGMLLSRTTGADVDGFAHDALGRMTLARRGTAGDPDAVSEVAIAYTDLGDPDFETQRIAAGAARLIDSAYDQAGNRTLLAYPGGETLTFTPTAINQVDAIGLDGQPLLDYRYSGRLLAGRATVTAAPGGAASYDYAVEYDSHRRVSGIANSFAAPGRGVETVAAYAYTHDGNGNPLSQVVTGGLPDFLGDDRTFAVDRLDRLTGTEYVETSAVETSVLDLLGNREAHTDRAGNSTQYGAVNAANEYATIGGTAVSYDAAGNLTVDEDGRQYVYDERNRLTEVRGPAPASPLLATYAYDALGRRIISTIGGVTTHYYYDGQRVIEERDGSSSGTGILPVVNARGGEDRLRFHVNGGQFIDERIASFDEAAGEFTYYLLNQNYSVAGMGNADGTVIERLDYSAGGDFGGGGAPPQDYFFDGDGDGDVDLADLESFLGCLTGPGRLGDRDGDGDIDLADFAAWSACLAGPGVSYGPECGWADLAGVSPANGGGGSGGASGGASPPDGDVDLADFAALTLVFDQPAGPLASACVAFDGDEDGDVDLADFSGFQECFSGSGQTPTSGCLRPTRGGVEHGRAADGSLASGGFEHGRMADSGLASSGYEHGRMASSSLAGGGPPRGDAAPSSGTFALHGRPVDVLPDGKTLIWIRARHYDPRHGRWLQRDPSGYADGGNLYESFGGNSVANTDPLGRQSFDPTQSGFFGASAADVRAAQAASAVYGGALQMGAPEVEARAAAEEILNPALEIATPAHKAAVGRVATTGVLVVLNVVPYAFGGVPGLVVNAVTFSLMAPRSYYERQAQFLETTGESLTTGESVAIVTGDMTGASAVYLVWTGEDMLTARPVGGAERAEAVAHLVVGLGTARIVPHTFPAIRSGTVYADQFVARSFVQLEQGYVRLMGEAFNARPGEIVLGTGLSPGRVPGQQLLFDFAEPSPPTVVYRVIRSGENPMIGLIAKNPSAEYSITAHVTQGNFLRTQYISTTRDFNVARRYAQLYEQPMVAIDLSRINLDNIIDLSSASARSAAGLTNPYAILLARRSAEVLIIREVPSEAVLPFVPLGGYHP